MTMLHDTRVMVWFERGVPYGAIWAGRHYRVTDTPTRLEDDLAPLTHPLALTGWRFQGTDDDDLARMFDVVLRDGAWCVARVYD
jgi:hypothetical protein